MFPDPCASRLLLQGVVQRVLEGDSHFGDVKTRGGFIEALESTLNDLDHAGIEPARIRDLSRRVGAGASGRKLADLALVHKGWHEALRAAGYESVAGLITRAARAAAAFPVRHLHIYGFYDLNGVQKQLVDELARGRDLTWYFPLVPPGDSAYSLPLREWLEQRGFIFAADLAPPVSPESTRLFSAAGERREAEEAVRRVLRLLSDGARPDRIAITYRSADPYGAMLRPLLQRAGVPAHCHDRPGICDTRPARALSLFVKAALSNYGRNEVMDFLDIALPMHPKLGGDSVALSSNWDRLTIDAGIVRGRAEWASRLELLARDDGRDRRRESGRPVAALTRVVEDLFRAIDTFMEAGAWRDFASRLRVVAEKWIGPNPDRDQLLELVAGLGEIDRTGEPATPAAFQAALDDLLARTRVPAEPEPRAAVHVGDILTLRGLAFDHVFLLGVTEKVFPRGAQPDPILPDRERELLNAGSGCLPLRGSTSAEEVFLFALLRSTATHLTLSYSRSEPARGGPRLPSTFLLRVGSELAGVSVDYRGLDAIVERVPLDLMTAAAHIAKSRPELISAPEGFAIGAVSALDQSEFDRMLVAMAAGPGHYERLAGLLQAGAPTVRRAIAADLARWRERRFTSYDGFMESVGARDALNALLPPERAYSSSRLEKYANCPFLFFLEHLLGVERIDSPEDQDGPEAMPRGSLIHRILQEFLAGHADADLDSSQGAMLEAELLSVASRCFDEFEKREVTGLPLNWAIHRAAMQDDLMAWLDFELDRRDGLRTARLEWSFGLNDDDGAVPALRLPLAGGREATFRGRVDRVDLSRDGSKARVVDYKTGRVRDDCEDDLDGGRRLQLASYLLAIRQAFPKLKSGTAEYLHINNGVESVPLKQTDFPTVRKDLSTTVGTLIEMIEAGRFFAKPESDGACRYCYRVCGAGTRQRFEMKRDDPRIRPFLKLRGEAD